MVDVEQRALRALEQDALAGAALVVEDFPDAVHIGQDFIGDRGQLTQDGVMRDFGVAEPPTQRIVVRQQPCSTFRGSVSKSAKSITRTARRPSLSS